MSDRFFGAWFAFCTLLALVLTGVGIWIAITLVHWVVTK